MEHRVSPCSKGRPKFSFVFTTFVYTIISVHSQFVPPKCSILCGIDRKEGRFQMDPSLRSRNSSRVVDVVSGECARNPGIASWNATSHLFLSSMGMGDSSFGCPRLNAVQQRLSETEIFGYWGVSRFPLYYYETPKQEIQSVTDNRIDGIALQSVPATCKIAVNRGLLSQTSNGPFVTSWIFAHTYPGLRGWVFGLVDASTTRFRLIRLPTDANDSCTGEGCKWYNLLWFASNSTTVREKEGKYGRKEPYVFSMFADFDYMQVPGMTLMVKELKQAIEKLDNVDNDLSPSNLAILCLPIVMSIPPISLLAEVSDAATVWYVLATDILAILPLLIKGVELVNVNWKANIVVHSMLSIMGRKHGLFERWEISCAPKDFKTETVGKIMILVAIWFAFASVYLELIFWQGARHSRKREDEMVFSDLTDGEILEMSHFLGLNESAEVEGADSNQKRRRGSAIRYAIPFTFSFVIVITLLVFSSYPRIWFGSRAALIWVSVILLVLLRALAIRQLRRFLRWRYVAGFLFGFFTGPLYLILHSFTSVRESEGWEDVSDGACAGFASSATSLYYGLTVFRRIVVGWHVPHVSVFVWIFGGSLVLVHVLRNLDEDKALWRCFGHGIMVGLLFGPLGFLFKRWICDIGTNERAETYFFLGFGFALNLGATISVYPLRFIHDSILP